MKPYNVIAFTFAFANYGCNLSIKRNTDVILLTISGNLMYLQCNLNTFYFQEYNVFIIRNWFVFRAIEIILYQE